MISADCAGSVAVGDDAALAVPLPVAPADPPPSSSYSPGLFRRMMRTNGKAIEEKLAAVTSLEGEVVCEPSRTEFSVVGLGTGVIVTTGHGTVFCKVSLAVSRVDPTP
jgi:hypothetical protein